MNKQKNLLFLTTFGGYPGFDAVFENQGYQATTANTLRKALGLIKQLTPEIIVAEFVYAPTYGSQLSNFESLFAASQSFSPHTNFIAITHKDDLHHLEKVKSDIKNCYALTLPVTATDLSTCLNSINGESINEKSID